MVKIFPCGDITEWDFSSQYSNHPWDLFSINIGINWESNFFCLWGQKIQKQNKTKKVTYLLIIL